MVNNSLRGIPFGDSSVSVSHLLFADDCLIFSQATQKCAWVLLHILKRSTCRDNPLILINLQYFSIQDISHADAQSLRSFFRIQHGNFDGKYLGFWISIGRKTEQAFHFIIDRIWHRLNDQKEKLLSFVGLKGHEVLIKAIVQALSAYTMTFFLMPKGICERIVVLT